MNHKLKHHPLDGEIIVAFKIFGSWSIGGATPKHRLNSHTHVTEISQSLQRHIIMLLQFSHLLPKNSFVTYDEQGLTYYITSGERHTGTV